MDGNSARRDFLNYALSLMRSHNDEHSDNLPVVDVAALKHVAYVLDALIYYRRSGTDADAEIIRDGISVHSWQDHDENVIDETDDDPVNQSVAMEIDSLDGESDVGSRTGRKHPFFQRSDSMTFLGCPPPDAFQVALVEALPLADQPHLLQPNSRKEELFGMPRPLINPHQITGGLDSGTGLGSQPVAPDRILSTHLALSARPPGGGTLPVPTLPAGLTMPPAAEVPPCTLQRAGDVTSLHGLHSLAPDADDGPSTSVIVRPSDQHSSTDASNTTMDTSNSLTNQPSMTSQSASLLAALTTTTTFPQTPQPSHFVMPNFPQPSPFTPMQAMPFVVPQPSTSSIAGITTPQPLHLTMSLPCQLVTSQSVTAPVALSQLPPQLPGTTSSLGTPALLLPAAPVSHQLLDPRTSQSPHLLAAQQVTPQASFLLPHGPTLPQTPHAASLMSPHSLPDAVSGRSLSLAGAPIMAPPTVVSQVITLPSGGTMPVSLTVPAVGHYPPAFSVTSAGLALAPSLTVPAMSRLVTSDSPAPLPLSSLPLLPPTSPVSPPASTSTLPPSHPDSPDDVSAVAGSSPLTVEDKPAVVQPSVIVHAGSAQPLVVSADTVPSKPETGDAGEAMEDDEQEADEPESPDSPESNADSVALDSAHVEQSDTRYSNHLCAQWPILQFISIRKVNP